jgi:hypothetical protein
MNRKSRIIKIFLLLFLLWLAGDRIFANLIEHFVLPLSDNRFAKMYSGRAKAKIVMLGNSRLDRHFNASILNNYFNKPAINLGIGGQSTELSNILLHDYIDRYGAPEIVILEPTNAFVKNEGLRDLRVFMNHSKRLKKVIKKELPTEYYFGNISHLYNFNNVMFNRILFEIVRSDKNRFRKDTISIERYNQIKKLCVSGREPKKSRLGNYSALKSIAEVCNEHNIDLKIVIVPNLRVVFARETYEDWIRELEYIFTHETIFDYSTALTNRKYFFDENHLNRKGVYKFYGILRNDGFFERQIKSPVGKTGLNS